MRIPALLYWLLSRNSCMFPLLPFFNITFFHNQENWCLFCLCCKIYYTTSGAGLNRIIILHSWEWKLTISMLLSNMIWKYVLVNCWENLKNATCNHSPSNKGITDLILTISCHRNFFKQFLKFFYLALRNYLRQGDHYSFSQLQWINNDKARPPPTFPVNRPDHITVISWVGSLMLPA